MQCRKCWGSWGRGGGLGQMLDISLTPSAKQTPWILDIIFEKKKLKIYNFIISITNALDLCSFKALKRQLDSIYTDLRFLIEKKN